MTRAFRIDVAGLGDRAGGLHVDAAFVGVFADGTLRRVVWRVGATDRLGAELTERQRLELVRVAGEVAQDPLDPNGALLPKLQVVGLRSGLARAPGHDQIAAPFLDVLPDLGVQAEEEVADRADLAVLVLEDVLADLERTEPRAAIVVGVGRNRIDDEIHREQTRLRSGAAADGDQNWLLLDRSTHRQRSPEVVDGNLHPSARSVLRRRRRQSA